MPVEQGSLDLLQHPAARELLQSPIPARLAYVWTDGTPRVVPIWFHWNGQEFVLGTPTKAPKLKALAKNPKVKVVADISGHQTLEGGFTAAQAILSAHPQVAAIYCLNDPMAAGAEQAIEQAGGGRNPLTNPVLVGFNGDPIALQLMHDGKLAADVAQNPYQQGVVAVDLAWSYLSGEKPTFTDAATKTVSVPVELVTPQTLPEFMERVKAGTAY